MRSWAMLAAVLALTGGCAAVDLPQPEGIAISQGVTLRLPDTPPFGEIRVVQLITARYKDRQESLQAVIEAGAGRLSVVVTLPAGPRVLSLVWHDGRIETKREALTPPSLAGARLLADIMTVYAPADSVRQALHGGRLVVGPAGARRILVQDQVQIAITVPQPDPWRGRASLDNAAYGYHLDIISRTLE